MSQVFPGSHKQITDGGVFFKSNGVATGMNCLKGNRTQYLSTEFKGSDVQYALGLSEGSGWSGRGDDYSKRRTILHELGHHVVDEFLFSTTVVDDMLRIYEPLGHPRDISYYSSVEYFADTFARFVFEQRQPSLPNDPASKDWRKNAFLNFGSGSSDLDKIVDYRQTAVLRGKSLKWYMKHEVLQPNLPGYTP